MSVYEGRRNYSNKSGCFRKNLADIPPVKTDCSIKPPHPECKKPNSCDSLKSIIEDMTENNPDSDRLLIIALIFLLAYEGADKKLLLALGYILL